MVDLVPCTCTAFFQSIDIYTFTTSCTRKCGLWGPKGPQYIEKICFNLIATLIEENKCLLLVVLQLFIMLGHGWGILCTINKLIFKIFQKVTQGDWY